MSDERPQLEAFWDQAEGEFIIYLPEGEFKRIHALLAQAHKDMKIAREMEQYQRESAEQWRRVAERNALLVRKYKEESDSFQLELRALQAQVFAGLVK